MSRSSNVSHICVEGRFQNSLHEPLLSDYTIYYLAIDSNIGCASDLPTKDAVDSNMDL